jgi:hypothetical protein
MEEEQNITIYVDRDGIVQNPTDTINSKKVIITIEITEEIKRDVIERNKTISFRSYFLVGLRSSYLKIIDNAGIQIIGEYFLWQSVNLINIDLLLYDVTKIENFFLSNCENLTQINLSPLPKVTQIGNYFLAECINLTNIDLAPLSNVTQIEDGFLDQCIKLTNIDLSPLSNVTQIRNKFMVDCKNLTNINLSQLSNVVKIGKYFLTSCMGLKNINLTGISNATQIGESFLYECTNLHSIKIAQHQKKYILKHNKFTFPEKKLQIDFDWYNTPKGKIWSAKFIRENNNIKNFSNLLEFIEYI